MPFARDMRFARPTKATRIGASTALARMVSASPSSMTTQWGTTGTPPASSALGCREALVGVRDLREPELSSTP